MNILEEAGSLGRDKDYGHPSKDMRRIASMWSLILNTHIEAEQVPLCMIALKISRQINKSKRDNMVDIAGYARVWELINA